MRINHIADNISPINTYIRGLTEYDVNSSKIAAEVKNLTITCEGEANWYCDPNVLEQILLNLVSNAVKYTKEGGRIEILIRPDSIEVANFPSHIDENIKEMVFEAFVTGGDKEAGHGLGLYVAKYFAELLGLRIEFESAYDKVVFRLLKERNE